MIEWPDIKFPPVNLHSLPHQRCWPAHYLTLESKYINDVMQEFYDVEEGKYKETLRQIILDRREEFNKLWNARAKDG